MRSSGHMLMESIEVTVSTSAHVPNTTVPIDVLRQISGRWWGKDIAVPSSNRRNPPCTSTLLRPKKGSNYILREESMVLHRDQLGLLLNWDVGDQWQTRMDTSFEDIISMSTSATIYKFAEYPLNTFTSED